MSTIEQALEAVLHKIKSGDKARLKEAEDQTKAWEEDNLPGYAFSLALYFSTKNKDPADRILCGVLLRGIWWAKDAASNVQKQQKWLKRMPEDAKAEIKELVLRLLADPIARISNQAAQIVARIALIELPTGGWRELLPILLGQMQKEDTAPQIKRATLETIGYICEEIAPEVLASSADQILTAVIQGMRPQEQDEQVKIAACNALFLALGFCSKNFENPEECAIILNSVLAAMAVPSEEVRVAAYAILTEVVTLHYDVLAPFMNNIFKITLSAIKEPKEEDIAKFAIEFWCTICDEELGLLEEIEYCKENGTQPPKCDCFIKGAVKFLAPLLTNCLAIQKKNVDADDWTVNMAAGVCLASVAQVVKDDVVPHVMPFVEANITSPDWKLKEAAVLAFGAILEGPSSAIGKFISQAIPILLQHLKDASPAVRDTTAWTIASILKNHPTAVAHLADDVLKCLCEALGDPSPKVAGHACFAIHNLAMSFQDEPSNPLHKFFVEAVKFLLMCADRPDSEEESLRIAAYESLNVVLSTAPDSATEALVQITREMITRLEKSFVIGGLGSQDDINAQNQLQGLLCGALQVLCQRLDYKVKPFADSMMMQVIGLFRSKQDRGVYEEGLLTVAAIANIVDADFEKYMNDLAPHLLTALQHAEEHQVCCTAVGLVGDISRALGPKMMPYCDRIITLLLQNLQSRDLERSVKPPILSCFGDIAIAIGGGFDKYLEVVLGMLKQAADTVMKTEIASDDYDLIDYINQLREGICEAYAGIIQGLGQDKKVEKISSSCDCILRFIIHIAQDQNRTEAVTVQAVGILGDLLVSFHSAVRAVFNQPSIQQLLHDCSGLDSSEAKKTAAWVRQVLQG
eukprot:TRINITY_DN3485_c0_g1_i1.p1 TRINITY_DN3485_c0_g1~~TRINITY_DN3485_c0_g1_i1.p1  ORF type:complete len:861 (+),score=238.86 TRINITY_DN3485_c0_g1_i1:44-2626(+)